MASSFWQSRSPSEKRLLLLLIVSAVVVGLAQWAWQAWHDNRRLREALPTLMAKSERLTAQTDEWRSLIQRPPKAVNQANLRHDIDSQLGKLGKDIKSSWRSPTELNLTGRTGFDSWVNWLGSVHQEFLLAVRRCQVNASGNGFVDVDCDLAVVN